MHAERYRVDYNTVRPHEALSWNRPHDVHVGLPDPRIPNFPNPKSCQLLDAEHADPAAAVAAPRGGRTKSASA